MNAANYNWTEPINRASDKPGEIQTKATELLLIGVLRSWTSALVFYRKSDGVPRSLAYRFWDFFPALQQSLERL